MPAIPARGGGHECCLLGVDDGASPGTVRAARVAGAVGTAVRAEDVLSARGLRSPPGYWDLTVVFWGRTQSWSQKDVLDEAVVPVGRTLFSKQPMKCIVSHSGVDMNV